tara:strand:- start:1615 stop:2502 length:888 start_codon:yes stop_codon:yes gene_type:complete
MKPLVSIIVNCKNGSKYLEKCLSSIKNQTFQDWEVIFFDNNSSDNSFEIFNHYKDNRFKYFRSKKNENLYKARNLACKHANGKYIAFLDTDDWWDENYLSSKKKFLINSRYDYLYSNVLLYNEKKDKFVKYKKINFPKGLIYNSLSKDYFIIISGLIIKKKLLEKEYYFNEAYNIIGDYDLIMRISKYANAKGFNRPLVKYRVHQNNFSKLNNRLFYEEYKNWFNKQSKLKDNSFIKNRKYFQLKLNQLEIKYLLYEKKTLNLLIKIVKISDFFLMIKFLSAFFLPLNLINFFRK